MYSGYSGLGGYGSGYGGYGGSYGSYGGYGSSMGYGSSYGMNRMGMQPNGQNNGEANPQEPPNGRKCAFIQAD